MSSEDQPRFMCEDSEREFYDIQRGAAMGGIWVTPTDGRGPRFLPASELYRLAGFGVVAEVASRVDADTVTIDGETYVRKPF
jgi:hypothetical protein